MSARPLLVLLPALLALAAVVRAGAERVVVEDWARLPLGTRGIPPDWKGQNWGNPAYDFTVVEHDGHRALHLRSRDDGSTISKDLRGLVNLRVTPVLEWRWKVLALPAGAHSCRAATDDQAAQVYVVWPRFPEVVRSRIIGYVWDTTAPVGTVCRSEKTGTVTYVVVRSGPNGLGTWFTEQRNVREDFRRIYGEEPPDPGAIAVGIDTNDTGSTAEAFLGPLVFRRP
jgi:hypothetical protein